ncbi:MAG: hypothetical protein L3J08_08805 [Flavobacteriaceae bacterium]|nr:hypothetical protein [Flavobacteriaceae bacterium]
MVEQFKSKILEKFKVELCTETNPVPQYRLMLYAFMRDAIMKNTLNKKTTILFYELLSEGLLNDNSRYLKERNIKYLRQIFDDKAIRIKPNAVIKKNVTIAYKNPQLLNRDMIFLAYQLKIDGIKKDITKFCSGKINKKRFSKTPEWAAILIRAKEGNRKCIDRLIAETKKCNIIDRTTLLFKDLALVKDEKVVLLLQNYLKSNDRLPQLKPTLPSRPIASYAAKSLSVMLDGFPKYKNYNSKSAIETCRKWMKNQLKFKFK